MMSREYELRSGDEIIATGRVTFDDAVEVGQRVAIGNCEGIVRDLTPPLGAPPPLETAKAPAGAVRRSAMEGVAEAFRGEPPMRGGATDGRGLAPPAT